MNFGDRRVRFVALILAVLGVIAAPSWLPFYLYLTMDRFGDLPDFVREVPTNLPCLDGSGYVVTSYGGGATTYSPPINVGSVVRSCKMDLAMDWPDVFPYAALSTLIAAVTFLLGYWLYRGIVWALFGREYVDCTTENCPCVDCHNHVDAQSSAESESEPVVVSAVATHDRFSPPTS